MPVVASMRCIIKNNDKDKYVQGLLQNVPPSLPKVSSYTDDSAFAMGFITCELATQWAFILNYITKASFSVIRINRKIDETVETLAMFPAK